MRESVWCRPPVPPARDVHTRLCPCCPLAPATRATSTEQPLGSVAACCVACACAEVLRETDCGGARLEHTYALDGAAFVSGSARHQECESVAPRESRRNKQGVSSPATRTRGISGNSHSLRDVCVTVLCCAVFAKTRPQAVTAGSASLTSAYHPCERLLEGVACVRTRRRVCRDVGGQRMRKSLAYPLRPLQCGGGRLVHSEKRVCSRRWCVRSSPLTPVR